MLALGATTEGRTFLPLPLGRSETKALVYPRWIASEGEGWITRNRLGELQWADDSVQSGRRMPVAASQLERFHGRHG